MKTKIQDMTSGSPGRLIILFCNSLDVGEYLSAALYNGGYYGRWPDCRCGGSCSTGCG